MIFCEPISILMNVPRTIKVPAKVEALVDSPVGTRAMAVNPVV